VAGLIAFGALPSIASSESVERAGPTSAGQIAYVRHFSPDDYEIFVINPDGSDRQRLTNDPAWNVDPAFSPDGEQIAFTRSPRRGTAEIYMMSSTGNHVRQVTADGYPESDDPSFSPDGERIVFAQRKSRRSDKDLFSMDIDGTDRRRLTNYRGSEEQPVYSPDGDQIAFERWKPGVDGDPAITVTNVDGSNPIEVDADFSLRPDFAPSGERVMFLRNLNHIWTAEADGGSPQEVLRNCDCFSPTYSPDGSQIALERGQTLRIIESDGAGMTTVPHTGPFVAWPEWGPAP
jgi:Tol biopolymer transport system component